MRNMFMIAMAIALVGYIVVPDRAAALHARVGLHRQRLGLHRRARRPARSASMSALSQPLRRGALDARRVRADDRLAARAARAHAAWRACCGSLYPFLMTFVIVVTANHFIVDALLGALTAGASAYGATWLARARPAAWRFSGVAPRLTASG